MTAIQLLFSLNEQKYLRKFYGLPAGLQGRQRTSDAFQDKIKDMQRFFNLKVSYLLSSLLILLIQMKRAFGALVNLNLIS